MAFVPGCGALDDGMLDRLAQADLLLFDGTFWTDDEMVTLGSERPHGAPDGSPAHIRLGRQPAAAADGSHAGSRYTPISTTRTRCSIEDSAQRREVVAAGLAVGDDGMRFSALRTTRR